MCLASKVDKVSLLTDHCLSILSTGQLELLALLLDYCCCTSAGPLEMFSYLYSCRCAATFLLLDFFSCTFSALLYYLYLRLLLRLHLRILLVVFLLLLVVAVLVVLALVPLALMLAHLKNLYWCCVQLLYLYSSLLYFYWTT